MYFILCNNYGLYCARSREDEIIDNSSFAGSYLSNKNVSIRTHKTYFSNLETTLEIIMDNIVLRSKEKNSI